jgi:hypothetical protein
LEVPLLLRFCSNIFRAIENPSAFPLIYSFFDGAVFSFGLEMPNCFSSNALTRLAFSSNSGFGFFPFDLFYICCCFGGY